MTLIPSLRRQRQAELCEFKVSLVYRVSSRTARAVRQRNPVSKQNKQTITTKKKTEKPKVIKKKKNANWQPQYLLDSQ